MRQNRRRMAGLLVGACLGLPTAANAGPVVNIMQPCDCPCTHYSAMHVLTPVLYRWAAFCQGPCRYTFARNWHPDLPPVDHFRPYHCPSVNPLRFSVQTYIGLANDVGLELLDLRRPSAYSGIKGQRAVEDAARNLPAIRHLAQRRCLDGRGDFGGYSLDR